MTTSLEKIRNYRKFLHLPDAEPVPAMVSNTELLKMPDKDFIKAVLSDIPKWRRGLSKFQYDAVDGLHQAVRDDLQEGSTYRTISCLNEIGIRTNFPKGQLKKFLQMSRGNDLAFLWFICLDRYGYPPKENYNIEEQLLISSISHLDAIPTMRALELILPPAHKAPKNKKKIERENQIKKNLRLYSKKIPYHPNTNAIYLQPQPVPIPFTKNLTATHPDMEIHLGFYENYKNKNYVVPNAKDRWYSDYRFKTKSESEFEQKASEKHAKTIICLEKYRAVRDVEISLQKKLNEIVANYSKKCENMKSKRRKQCIIAELQKMVNRHLQNFRECSDKMRLRPLIDLMTCQCEELPKVNNNKKKISIEETTGCDIVPHEDTNSKNKPIYIGSKCFDDYLKTPTASQTYFKAPQKHCQYYFDYLKIYNFPPADDEQKYLQHVINATLGREMALMLEKDKETMLMQDNCCEAVEPTPNIAIFYDCNDSFLMRNILIAALEYLALHDKSLLVPTLPEAYKLFVIREFALRRYGKKYATKERRLMYEISMKIIKVLYDEWEDIKFPSDRPIFSVKSYKCYGFAKHFAKTWKKKYLERVENQLMHYSRSVWVSTRLAAHSFSKQGFFSYLPAKPSETRYLAF